MMLVFVYIIVGFFYALLILAFTVGWVRLSEFRHQGNNIRISVIIPARNEEKNILRLLIALQNQHYPKDQYEVIVVDDHSTDNTAALVESRIEEGFFRNAHIIRAGVFGIHRGKKNALTIGIRQASYAWIATLDADCFIGSDWLQSLAGFIKREEPSMVIGPVVMAYGKSWFSQVQALEFMSLAGVMAGGVSIGKPVLCSGANLAFRKDYFEAVGGYDGNDHLASGDDVFLLHKFKKNKGARIAFLKNHKAIAYTYASSDLKEFFCQRGRWAGKAGHYRDKFTLLTGGIVALTNILIVFGIFVGVVFSQKLILAALYLLIIKMLTDFPLLFSVSSYFRQCNLMWLYPVLALVYPFYTIVSLITGFVLKPGWKP